MIIRCAVVWQARPRRVRLVLECSHLVAGRRRASAPCVPFGWFCWPYSTGRAVWLIAPWWVLGPKLVYYRLSEGFFRWAIRHGCAETPYEGCYWHELRWFPSFPRWTP